MQAKVEHLIKEFAAYRQKTDGKINALEEKVKKQKRLISALLTTVQA